MGEVKTTKESSHWWWVDSDNGTNIDTTPRRSRWLRSTLAELDEKTKAMLRIIEEDADSFAQRAEMYYKKRYDQAKSDTGFRLITPWASPLSSKYRQEKSMTCTDKSYDSYSEIDDPVESGESEVDDPVESGESEVDDPEEEKYQIEKEMEKDEVSSEVVNDEVMKLRQEIKRLKEENKSEVDDPEEEKYQTDKEIEEEEVSSKVVNDEVVKLREEIERLEEENKIQKEQLAEKDEKKREVIRQLSLAMDALKDENMNLRKFIAKESPKKQSLSEFDKLKGMFLGKFFSKSPKSRDWDKARTIEEEDREGPGSGKDTDGNLSMVGSGASVWSGLGGLGLEGMVGIEDSEGEGAAAAGEGKSGVMSGDKVGENEVGRNEGAAEMVEVGKLN
ncbi:unnamed protein product [Camellia sinensis]